MQNRPYQLQWLDVAVTDVLSPHKSNFDLFSEMDLRQFKLQLSVEIENQMTFLKKQALLRINNQRLIYQYRMMIVRLLDQSHQNARLVEPTVANYIMVSEQMIIALKQILDLVDQLFSNSIYLSQPVPLIEIQRHRDFIADQLTALKENLLSKIGSDQLATIILNCFEHLDKSLIITGRDIQYRMKLLRAMLQIPVSFDLELNHQRLISTMVYHNFNSKAFLNYYASMVSHSIQIQQGRGQKMTALLSWYKKFKQLHHSRQLIYNPSFDSVKKVLSSWFKEEFRFLENSDSCEIQQPSDTSIKKGQTEISKILCLLSVDQISLVLRALDSLRIIQVKSFNSLVQNLTPYLATPRKEDISWQSLRSKSYTIEENGRAELIKILESVITWIREY